MELLYKAWLTIGVPPVVSQQVCIPSHSSVIALHSEVEPNATFLYESSTENIATAILGDVSTFNTDSLQDIDLSVSHCLANKRIPPIVSKQVCSFTPKKTKISSLHLVPNNSTLYGFSADAVSPVYLNSNLMEAAYQSDSLKYHTQFQSNDIT